MAKLAVFFPGMGYHCDKPLLYYGRDIAYEAGYESCIKINYEYPKFDIKNPESMLAAALELLRQASEQLSEVKWDEYEEVIFSPFSELWVWLITSCNKLLTCIKNLTNNYEGFKSIHCFV